LLHEADLYIKNGRRGGSMVVEFNHTERELLISQLEVMILPELRCQIGSGIRKELRDELKKDKVMLTEILEKLKATG